MKQDFYLHNVPLGHFICQQGVARKMNRTLSDKPVPSGEGMSTYVPIDWEQTDIQSFNPETGELSLVFNWW